MNELNKHQQNLIDRLFGGQLPQAEQEVFKKEMKEKDFKEAVRMRSDLRQMLAEESATDPLKKRLQDIEKKIAGGGRVIRMRRWLAVAAGVAVLVMAGFFLIENINGGDPIQKNYAEIKTFQKDPKVEANRSGNNAEILDSISTECKVFYYEGNYQKALGCFIDIQKTDKSDPEASYYVGVSQFQLDQFEAAMNTFEEIITQGYYQNDLATQDQVRWNRLVAQIMSENPGYETELQAFANDPNFKYYSDAKRLQAILK